VVLVMADSSTAPVGVRVKADEGKGYNVSVVQNQTTTLAADVAAPRLVLDAQDGPAILVGSLLRSGV